jgi:IS1 family transposase
LIASISSGLYTAWYAIYSVETKEPDSVKKIITSSDYRKVNLSKRTLARVRRRTPITTNLAIGSVMLPVTTANLHNQATGYPQPE